MVERLLRLKSNIAGWLLLIIFALIVVHAPLSVFFGVKFPSLDLIIKSWKEIFMAIAGLVLLIVVIWRGDWRWIIKDKLFWLVSMYILLHFLTMFFAWNGVAATIAGAGIDLRYIFFFSLVYIFLKTNPLWRKRFIIAGISGACVVLIFAVMQIFLPKDFLTHLGYGPSTIMPYGTVDKNHDYIRISSTLRGPNPLGAYASVVGVMLASMVTWAIRTKFWQKISNTQRGLISVLATGAIVAVWLSYSRSAILALVLGVSVVLAINFARKVSWKVWLSLAIVVVAGYSLLSVYGRSNPVISNVVFHENPGESGNINSDEAHVDSLNDGVNRMIHQPFGAGVGSTGSASLLGDKPLIIENQYLFIAHEVGWLGLGLFLAICGVVLYRLWQVYRSEKRAHDLLSGPWWTLGVFAAGIGLMVVGLIQPVWADDTVSIIWWGLAGIMLSKDAHIIKNKHKKARQDG